MILTIQVTTQVEAVRESAERNVPHLAPQGVSIEERVHNDTLTAG